MAVGYGSKCTSTAEKNLAVNFFVPSDCLDCSRLAFFPYYSYDMWLAVATWIGSFPFDNS